MASEAVKKILEAEAQANKKNVDAKQRSEDMINDAMGNAAAAVQKKLSEAAAEAERERADYLAQLKSYTENAENECSKRLEAISAVAEKNMNKAADAIIEKYF
ncbi:MAG: hypothetical protein IJ487_03590 [Ruminococcus sp.]|nr:hypothetical protein [Ruminococcus sp.]